MELHTIRRFGVDIYRYRKEALALRAQTRTEFFRSAGRVFRPVILAIIAAYLSMRVIAPSAAAEVPETIAARGEIADRDDSCDRRASLRVQDKFRRQIGLAVPRADRDADDRRQDRRPPFCGTGLGDGGWQRRECQGFGAGAGRDRERYSASETGCRRPAWVRTSQRSHDDPTVEHARWPRRRGLRFTGNIPERTV